MEQIDHNGPNFHYIVGYRKTDGSDGSEFITNQIYDYKQSKPVLFSTFVSIKSNTITSNHRKTGVNVLALVNRF